MKRTRRTGTNLVLGLFLCTIALVALIGDLNASEPVVPGDERTADTTTENVRQVVGGRDYKGVLEISRTGIAYVSEYAEWLEFIPWDQVLGWNCFGSMHSESDEESLCTLWIQLKKGAPHAATHLFFMVPCEMIPGHENWEILESYDPRGRF
jgi:hypothetical protein